MMITKRKLFNNIKSYTKKDFFFKKDEVKMIIRWINQVKKRRNKLFVEYRKKSWNAHANKIYCINDYDEGSSWMAKATNDAIQEMRINFPNFFAFISEKDTEILLDSIIMGILLGEY